MTKVIAVSMAKGGVGKTTTAVNLSAGLAAEGRRVLLIDMDTQNQVCGALGIDPPLTVADFVLDGNRKAIATARDNLHILAGGAVVNRIVNAIREKQFMPHTLLSEAMGAVDGVFDYVIVDTAPSWGEIAINVLAYADELMTPIPLEMLALRGLQEFLTRARPIIGETSGELRYIVPTMLDRRYSQTGEILAQLQKTFGDLVTDPIRSNIRLSEAPAHGQHIFEYAPRSRGAEDYRALTKRIIDNE